MSDGARVQLPSAPKSLADPDAVITRAAYLANAPHMGGINAFVKDLRQEGLGEVPDVDPFDGGINAKYLFLMEKPGPMTSRSGSRAGSGFVSRDNNDETAAAIFRFMEQAGLDRRDTILWNVVPWWNNTRRITAPELRSGVDRVHGLISLLPRLTGIAFVGSKAAKAKPLLEDLTVRMVSSAHPSPIVRASKPDAWCQIPDIWRMIAAD